MYSLRRWLERVGKPRQRRQHCGSVGQNIGCLEDESAATSFLGRRGKIRRPPQGADIELLEVRTLLSTFTVTTTADVVDAGDGVVSLREALTSANAHANSDGPDLIDFNIAADDARHFYYQNDGISGQLTGNVATTTAADDADIGDIDPDHAQSWYSVAPSSAMRVNDQTSLPTIDEPLIIDGYTQPGASPNTNGSGLGDNAVLRIELDGSSAGPSNANTNGLVFNTTESSTVRGLAINRFSGNGVDIGGRSTFVEIQGNFIGTDISGTLARGMAAAVSSWAGQETRLVERHAPCAT